MRGGVLAELVDLVADRGQFVDVERRPERMAGARAASGCRDLDKVGAFLDQLPDGSSALSGTRGLDSEVAQMAADDGNGPAGEHKAGDGTMPISTAWRSRNVVRFLAPHSRTVVTPE